MHRQNITNILLKVALNTTTWLFIICMSMCIPLRHTFKHKPIVSFYEDALFLSFKLELF